MEKISALIDKLQELKNSNAGLQSISYYVQLLQAEVLHARNMQREREQGKQEQRHVAVIMPSAAAVETAQAITNGHTTAPQHYTTTGPAMPPAQPVQAAPAPPPVQPVAPAAQASTPPEARQAPPAPKQAERRPQPPPATLFDDTEKKSSPLKELKELNERVAQTIPSLNDRLRQNQVELAERLGDMPVKDLRHAIGINDKFQFIQELFRGDVDVYERSVKTINELHSLQEAEYWIERELKIRQGWEEDNRTVKQFYSLVRKRFS